jgi:hypothetical protein
VKGLGEGFAKAFRDSIANGYGNGMPNQEQEQEQEQEQKKDNASGDAPPSRPEMFPDAWNRLSGPLPKVREFTEDRKRKVKARITQGLTLATFEEAVQKCTLTPFLSGVNDRAWKADFDWLVSNGTHVTAVLEGKYDSSSASPAPSGIPRPPTREEQVERQSAEDDEERRFPGVGDLVQHEPQAHKAVNPWQGRKFGEETEAGGMSYRETQPLEGHTKIEIACDALNCDSSASIMMPGIGVAIKQMLFDMGWRLMRGRQVCSTHAAMKRPRWKRAA